MKEVIEEPEEILTVANLAALLKCKPSSVYNLTRRRGRARYEHPVGIAVALRVALPSVVHHGMAGRSGDDVSVYKINGFSQENESDTAVVAAIRQFAQVLRPRPTASHEKVLLLSKPEVLTTE